jgi:hypothetical protein
MTGGGAGVHSTGARSAHATRRHALLRKNETCAAQGSFFFAARAARRGGMHSSDSPPSKHHSSSSIALPGAVRMAGLATVERFLEEHFTSSIGSTATLLSRCSRGIAVRSAEAAPAESGGARRAASSAAFVRAGGVPLWVLVGACAAQGPPEELVMADGGGWTPTATPASSASSAGLSAARAPTTASTRNSSRGRVAIVALERGGRVVEPVVSKMTAGKTQDRNGLVEQLLRQRQLKFNEQLLLHSIKMQQQH